MKTLLITGSGGFIGKNLKTYLEDQYNILCPRSFELDLTDKNFVEKYFNENNIDFIIHCGSIGGARGIKDKDTTIENNLSMVNNLVFAKKENCRIILFGSGAMYGKDRDLHKIQEQEIGNYVPNDLYGKSKLEIYKVVQDRRDILMLNIFACYGYGEKENRFPSYAINQVLRNKPVEINQNCIFDYLFVEDMQKIVANFIENKPKHKVINMTPAKSISLLDIAKIVNDISDIKVDIIIKNPKMNFEYTGDNTLLLDEIPNFEFTDYKKGLNLFYDYLKSNMFMTSDKDD